MKQLAVKQGQVVIEEVPEPVLSGEGVVVKTHFSVISSGTELGVLLKARESTLEKLKRMMPQDGLIAYLRRKITSGTLLKSTKGVASSLGKGSRRGPLLLGYSSAGIVEQVSGTITTVRTGEGVACAGARHAAGNFVSKNLFAKIPAQVSLREAAFTTIGCIALQGVRRAQIQPGETVVIIGLGLIGQITAQLARLQGAHSIVTDLQPFRLDVARRIGAQTVINAAERDAVTQVRKITKRQGADKVIICASSASAGPVKDAIAMARDKGKIVLVGNTKIEIPREPFYEKELDFVISRSYGPGRYDPLYEEKGKDYPFDYVRWTENRNMDEFLRLLAEKKLNIRDLISAEFDISEADKAYETILQNPQSTLGVLLRYTEGKGEQRGGPTMATVDRQEPCPDKIKTAVIGCGNFATKYHIPNLRKIDAYRLTGVADVVGIKAKSIAKKYHVPFCTSDYKKILSNNGVELVVITTRHNLHVPLAIEAVQAGKHVLVEKPMAMNEKEMKDLIGIVRSSDRIFMVGFNRRFSPLIQEARKNIAEVTSPIVINYRVANTYSPAASWVHDPEEGGGTIIGECCHFFDLLYFLIGREPVRIFAEGGNLTHPGSDIYDNAVITVMFAGGSIATITFTDLASDQFPKERIEIFAPDGTMVIDDFRRMSINSTRVKEIVLKKSNKGHYEQFLVLSKAIGEKGPSPVSYKDGARASVCCFKTLESIKTGQPQRITL